MAISADPLLATAHETVTARLLQPAPLHLFASGKSTTLTVLPAGHVVEIKEHRSSWLKVRASAGSLTLEGYIEASRTNIEKK